MRIVFKYEIPGPGIGSIWMPKDAECLFAREQFDKAYVWALVDPSAELKRRHFLAAETGNTDIPDGVRYLGTAMLDAGAFVLHIFEPAFKPPS